MYKNPPNKKTSEFILTLGENEFGGLRGFQCETLSVEFVTRRKQQCTTILAKPLVTNKGFQHFSTKSTVPTN